MESDCYGVMEEALDVPHSSVGNYSDMFDSIAGTKELIEMLREIANDH